MANDPLPKTRRQSRMLAELAEQGLSAARDLHDKVLATHDPKAISALSEQYVRIAREVREAIALKARLDRELAAQERAHPEQAEAARRRRRAMYLRRAELERARLAQRTDKPLH